MLFPRFYSAKRVLVQGWPFVVLFVAWLFTRQEKNGKSFWQLLLGISLASMLIVTFFIPKDDWRGAITYINAHAESDAILWLDPPWTGDVTSIYRPAIQPQGSNPENIEQLRGRDVWIISERYPNLTVPHTRSEAWLDQNLKLVEAIPFFRLEVRHYIGEQ
jgi:hypothetical protein